MSANEHSSVTVAIHGGVRMQLQIHAAEQTVALLPGTKPTKRTGS